MTQSTYHSKFICIKAKVPKSYHLHSMHVPGVFFCYIRLRYFIKYLSKKCNFKLHLSQCHIHGCLGSVTFEFKYPPEKLNSLTTGQRGRKHRSDSREHRWGKPKLTGNKIGRPPALPSQGESWLGGEPLK